MSFKSSFKTLQRSPMTVTLWPAPYERMIKVYHTCMKISNTFASKKQYPAIDNNPTLLFRHGKIWQGCLDYRNQIIISLSNSLMLLDDHFCIFFFPDATNLFACRRDGMQFVIKKIFVLNKYRTNFQTNARFTSVKSCNYQMNNSSMFLNPKFFTKLATPRRNQTLSF